MKNPNPAKYRQEGPRDELVALISSAWGDLSVARFGPNNKEQIVRAEHTLGLALEILRGMTPDKWDK